MRPASIPVWAATYSPQNPPTSPPYAPKPAVRRVRLETRRVRVDVAPVDPAVVDQDLGDPIEQDQIALRPDGVVVSGGHRGLGLARIDHDDGGAAPVLADTLPHDGVGDAEVG